ncbi:MAG: hypothetical protein M0Z31_01805 [Clostridia bacterium]|nr:hypothetical protein [Clostridia bacterium]
MVKEENIRIELTGNPFVDTGLAVISSLAGLDDISKLTFADIKSVYDNGQQLTEWNSKVKAFTQIFGTNNPLFQPSYRVKKGKGPSDINKRIYISTLEGLISKISKTGHGLRCWACGCPSDYDFAQICKEAIEEENRKKAPEDKRIGVPEDKWIGRDWFPLAGSLGSDAQALPAASRPPNICPRCLFAIHYLPMGLILLNGRLVVFQCTSIEFWYELVRDIVSEGKGRIQSGNYESLGSKEGSSAVMRRLLALFNRLQKDKQFFGLPAGTSLYIWRFSNSGASPECQIEEIPNPAIVFLWDAVQEGLHSDIESIMKFEGKNPRYALFQCILDRRDYPNLYPEGKRKGASLKLFSMYQTRIRNHSIKALRVAHKLAKEVSGQISEKELKRIQRPEAFKEEKARNKLRSVMVQMAERGELTLEDYIDLFPSNEGRGFTTEWDGWNLIRFYLHHTNEGFPEIEDKYSKTNILNQPLFYYAGQIYNRYISEKGKDRFQKEVLNQMDRKIGVPWLQNQFLQLAELSEGFTYGHWSTLCKSENGRLFVLECFHS